MVIDDDEACRAFMARVFSILGYEVRVRSSADVCRRRAACACGAGEACTNVILTDNQMPGRTGLEFLLEQKRKGCHCPRIAIMSGTWTDAELRMARDNGWKIFTKPVTLGELREWLQGCEEQVAIRELKEFAFEDVPEY